MSYENNQDNLTDEELDILTSPGSNTDGALSETEPETQEVRVLPKKKAKASTSPNATKIKKLEDERSKNAEKMRELQNRNAEIEREIRQLQNSDLAALFHSSGLSFSDVVAYLQQKK